MRENEEKYNLRARISSFSSSSSFFSLARERERKRNENDENISNEKTSNKVHHFVVHSIVDQLTVTFINNKQCK